MSEIRALSVPWRLGSKIAGAVAFDNANYIEVNINGTTYKLALAT